jgi:IclR family transcriptional regulator, pca regulon regulatory protein
MSRINNGQASLEAYQKVALASPSPEMPSSPVARIDALSGDPNFMTSFARGLAVIQGFSGHKRRMTISQLSIKIGLSRAAVRRCLYTLVKLGFAGSEDNHYFYLNPRILSLGYSYISSMPLLATAQPVLEQMSDRSRESCWIGMLENQEVICVAHANATRVMSLDIRVGSRVPAFCTAIGQVLLASLPSEEQEACIARIKFTRYTKHTPGGAVRLRQILRLVRRNGYAVVDQGLQMGVRALAVPIRHPSGTVIAALCIAAVSLGVSTEVMLMKFLPRLQDGAQDLSMLLK